MREVKSFLQTLQFNSIYLAAEGGEKSYPKLTEPLRKVTRRGARFTWTQRLEQRFQERKNRLHGDRVMVPYDTARETRLYTDSGPEETQAMVAQRYEHPTAGTMWRPVNHTARAWTEVEKG